jgi:hypothetical protein
MISTKAAHINTQGNLFLIMALNSITARGTGKEKSLPFSSLPKQRTRQGGVGSAPSYAMIAAMMEIDYWKNRCVGEAIDQGYTAPDV